MPPRVALETPRLRLVHWEERHLEPLVRMHADPEVMRFFPSTLSRERTLEAVEKWRCNLVERGWSIWAVEAKGGVGFVGMVGLEQAPASLPFAPCVEVAWRLARSWWGRGLATEAARACLDFGFGTLGLEEIVAFTALPNARSMAVMERLGMRDTGLEFDHPSVPEGSGLRRHRLYRIARGG